MTAIEQTAIEQYRNFNPWLRETWPSAAAGVTPSELATLTGARACARRHMDISAALCEAAYKSLIEAYQATECPRNCLYGDLELVPLPLRFAQYDDCIAPIFACSGYRPAYVGDGGHIDYAMVALANRVIADAGRN